MKNIKIGVRLTLGFVVTAMLVLFVGGEGVRRIGMLQDDIYEIASVRTTGIAVLSDMSQNALNISLGIRLLNSFDLDANGRQQIHTNIENQQKALLQAQQKFAELQNSNDAGNLVRGLPSLLQSFIGSSSEAVELSKEFLATDILNPAALTVPIRKFQLDHYARLGQVMRAVMLNTVPPQAPDHNNCAFAKWSQTYQPRNPYFKTELEATKVPHEAFHNAALKVDKAMQFGDTAQAQRVILDELYPNAMEVLKHFDNVMQAANESSAIADKLNLLVTGKAQQAADKLHGTLEEISAVNLRLANDSSAEAFKTGQSAVTTMIAGSAIAMLVAIGLGILLSRSVTVPVSAGVVFAKAVASGDLSRKLEVRQGDEIGTLADAMRTMVDNLKKMIAVSEQKTREAEEQTQKAGLAMKEAEQARLVAENAKREGMLHAAGQLEGIVETVINGTSQISEQVQQASAGADAQLARAAETAAAMTEMSATVTDVARNAGDAAEGADNARKYALQGQVTVNAVIQAIDQANAKTATLKTDLSVLGDKANGIGQIMNVISDIADQTNLLALNAAIEAARAGDAGRGFAVVADEVRKLAEKTMQATNQVGSSVKDIQQGTMGSIHGMEEVSGAVDESNKMAGEAGEVLKAIVGLVQESADRIRSIAAASEEQSAASEEINHGTEDINRIANETAEAMHNTDLVMRDMRDSTAQLHKMVEELKKA